MIICWYNMVISLRILTEETIASWKWLMHFEGDWNIFSVSGLQQFGFGQTGGKKQSAPSDQTFCVSTTFLARFCTRVPFDFKHMRTFIQSKKRFDQSKSIQLSVCTFLPLFATCKTWNDFISAMDHNMHGIRHGWVTYYGVQIWSERLLVKCDVVQTMIDLDIWLGKRNNEIYVNHLTLQETDDCWFDTMNNMNQRIFKG